MDENQKNSEVGMEKKSQKENNSAQDPEIKEGSGVVEAGLTQRGDMGQNQEKARRRKSAGVGCKLQEEVCYRNLKLTSYTPGSFALSRFFPSPLA